jgi:calcium-dependent protein kinase
VIEPSQRITAADALQHPFFGILERRATAPEMLSLMKKAEIFRDSSRIRRAALTVLAMNANHSEEVERLRERFCEIDTDKNGFLDEKEFKAIIENVGQTYSYASQIDLPAILKAMDTDGSGRVDYMEFLAASLDTKMYEIEECRAAFQVFDKDGNGKIDKSELESVLRDGGKEDGLRSLTFEEFHELVTGGVDDGTPSGKSTAFNPKPRYANGTNGH